MLNSNPLYSLIQSATTSFLEESSIMFAMKGHWIFHVSRTTYSFWLKDKTLLWDRRESHSQEGKRRDCLWQGHFMEMLTYTYLMTLYLQLTQKWRRKYSRTASSRSERRSWLFLFLIKLATLNSVMK